MIDTNKEWIACSAIHYDNGINYPWMSSYGVKTGFVLCGFRHPHIISVLPTNTFCKSIPERAEHLNVEWKTNELDEDKKPKFDYKVVQGFMTSLGRFVGREEAYEIAVKSGQIEEEKYNGRKVLFSEDIFPEQVYVSTL